MKLIGISTVERGEASRNWSNVCVEGSGVEVVNFEPKLPLIFDALQYPEGTVVELWVPEGLR